MRTPFIAGNWKMHKTIVEAVDLVRELGGLLEGIEGCDVAVCPPFPALAAVRETLAESVIGLGAQNMDWEEQGAFTGEVSPRMLAGLCDYVIIGHSERRTLFGETDGTVNQKLHAALAHGLEPILCVVLAAFKGISAEQAQIVTVAYEPIWAIGTGMPATGEGANSIIGGTVRGTLSAIYGEDVAQIIRIQYGGSVKPSNTAEFMSQPEIDGALVGGASLRAADFATIVQEAAKAKSTDK